MLSSAQSLPSLQAEAREGFLTRLPPAAPAGGGKWPELLLGLLARVINPQLAGAQECSAHKDVAVDAYLRKSATSCAFAECLRGGGGAS